MINRVKKRLRLGDIYEVELPNGKKAYGRLFKEYVLAFYKTRCHDVSELPDQEDYEFFVGWSTWDSGNYGSKRCF